MVFIKNRIGISLLITVILCLGFVYANVQAASTLSKWYTDTFQKEDEILSSTLETGVWTTFKRLGVFIAEAKQDAITAIEESRNKQVEESTANIEALVTDMKEQIDQTVTELDEENFDAFVERRNIEEEIERDVATMLAEILDE
ncbi:hypothetical protein JSQ81_15655 [Sporosarcina sp. Marseille-Q4063]|uniref:hypothetical protein n=1 Tax=Sporosarcina sp. Marseille-Q4063 TaxID=2810514 RepID=UPI001BB0C706|nr:hypothetical protein [Sporosarcina sp. Marseille-Q4063]QUW21231.1 hypothetical protein JSQ81_15655 [Sporosarcina sp. Marseille-Q4063]